MIIIVAGGHAKMIMDIIIQHGTKILTVFDKNPSKHSLYNFSVSHIQESNPKQNAIIAVGDNLQRKKL